MLFGFFRFFIFYVYFNEAFVKTFLKKLSLLIRKSFQDVVYYRMLGCQAL